IAAQANRAQALIHQERYDEVTPLLEKLEKRARDVESLSEESNAVQLQGQVARRQGRLREAESLQRRARAMAEGQDELGFSFSSVELAGVLRESGRPAESIAVLDSLPAPRGVEMSVDDRAYAWMEKSAGLAAQGKAREALAAARQAERL